MAGPTRDPARPALDDGDHLVLLDLGKVTEPISELIGTVDFPSHWFNIELDLYIVNLVFKAMSTTGRQHTTCRTPADDHIVVAISHPPFYVATVSAGALEKRQISGIRLC